MRKLWTWREDLHQRDRFSLVFPAGANVTGALKLNDIVGPEGNFVPVLLDPGLKYLSTHRFP